MDRRVRPLDLRIEVVTPENVAFHYVVAGPFRRLPAFLFDVALRGFVLAVFYFLAMLMASAAGMAGLGMGAGLVAWFILAWFYGGLFETFWNGQTPGKRLFNLRVLTVEGQPINALQAVLRNVLRDVDSMPLFATMIPLYTLGLGAMAANARFQRLGDLAAGTIVVVERRGRLRGVAPLETPQVAALAGNLPLRFPVGRSLAQTLASYEARRHLFSPQRRAELAEILAEPLRQRFGLPAETDADQLLRAVYFRTFIADRASPPPAVLVEPLVEVTEV